MVDIKNADATLRAYRTTFFSIGDEIDQGFLEWFAETDYTLIELVTLFPKGGRSPESPHRYLTFLKCKKCTQEYSDLLSKSHLRDVIKEMRGIGSMNPYKAYRIFCQPCKHRIDKEIKESRDAQNAQFEEQIKNSDKKYKEEYVGAFLDSNKSWKETCAHSERWRDVSSCRVDISEEIKAMDYGDFLRTPYWKAIAQRVKYKAGFKCAICGGSERIAAHHRSYDLHGYEHTVEGMRELTCLCEDCHSTHHGK